MTPGDAELADTGSVRVVDQDDAAEAVDAVDDASTGRLLIALDIDGTVILEDESPSPGVVEAVAHAHQRGHEVMLATGRSWESTHRIMELLDIRPEYAVCSNGAIVMGRRDLRQAQGSAHAGARGVPAVEGSLAAEYERVHVETFDPAEVLTLLQEHLSDARYLVELPDGTRLYTEYLEDWNLRGADRVEFEALSHQPVCRVVVVSPGQTDTDFLELVSRIGLTQVSYAIGWTAWLDIAPQGVNKATGLELVRGWLGIDPANVLVMGDGRNDLEMFEWALRNGGRAVAMGQGPEEVRTAAGEIGLSVTEGGVAAILRAL
ncbi:MULTISPECIES: HAD family hydrolase [Microbacterium]|uniref:Haloacid dehalogenase n=1 Tax=Microbacterium wangchenii TaxID=2541726 RepID=A0ABX5SV89_9MICO|nr:MULTISPECIES: HAD hydrolase family protein [Microbacterium]MCK6065784.1 HAD hydrolase family protein [Microbacterium sp. EYE_512]QBR90098.1 haloacid dehalogenase [Microbacterium wangchenii]TFV85093.1 haloacid dehalogenase [Microbacterium sp. dk485]TXK11886.1 HAD hydrolase family protein [Microbacterium wangchenii]